MQIKKFSQILTFKINGKPVSDIFEYIKNGKEFKNGNIEVEKIKMENGREFKNIIFKYGNTGLFVLNENNQIVPPINNFFITKLNKYNSDADMFDELKEVGAINENINYHWTKCIDIDKTNFRDYLITILNGLNKGNLKEKIFNYNNINCYIDLENKEIFKTKQGNIINNIYSVFGFKKIGDNEYGLEVEIGEPDKTSKITISAHTLEEINKKTNNGNIILEYFYDEFENKSIIINGKEFRKVKIKTKEGKESNRYINGDLEELEAIYKIKDFENNVKKKYFVTDIVGEKETMEHITNKFKYLRAYINGINDIVFIKINNGNYYDKDLKPNQVLIFLDYNGKPITNVKDLEKIANSYAINTEERY